MEVQPLTAPAKDKTNRDLLTAKGPGFCFEGEKRGPRMVRNRPGSRKQTPAAILAGEGRGFERGPVTA
ncbi:hypothetical protein Ruko_16610 [Ruthenibacterium sp. TH_2024_36131]